MSFDQAVADEICDRITAGESLKRICRDEHMPSPSLVFKWLAAPENEAFRDQYARARDAQADALADEILSIADEGENDTYRDEQGNIRTDNDVIQRSKLRVDARKWIAAKLKPKKYGDKIDVTSGDEPVKLDETAMAARVAALLRMGLERDESD